MSGGGRFDFDDGGTYCGGWEDGKAHGNGVCTGPKGQGEYSGAWQYGFEASGVYTWPSGNCYEGQWTQGKRHGLGVEKKGHWVYRGEWTQGFKGRYGVRHSTGSGAKYEGTWTTGLQDGYGVETYADGVNRLPPSQRSPTDPTTPEVGKNVGTYQGQWLRGMRHGYGVRHSVPYGLASHYRPKGLRTSLTSLRSEAEDDNIVKDRDRKVDESRGGFVLKARSDESPGTRRRSIFDRTGRSSLRKSLLAGLKLRKQKSTGDIQDSPRRPTGSVRSTVSNVSHLSGNSSNSGITSASLCTDSNLSFVSQDDITDVNVTETYMGEWKNDKRSGFGISERSDGLKYEGEWYNNKKYGYGVTTFKDGTKEEGKYKNNVLISSGKKSKLFLIRSSKLRDRVDNAVAAAQRAAQIAHQKADIAISRMANARAKAEQADLSAEQARRDSDIARVKAKQFAPEFHQPGFEWQTSPSSGVQPAGRPSTGPEMNQSGNSGSDFQRQRMEREYGGHTESSNGELNCMPAGVSQHRTTRSSLVRTPDLYSDRHTPTPMSALVSSALDCAIAGSSSHLVDSLHKYEPDIDRSYPVPPAGSAPPGGGRPQHLDANHRGPEPQHNTYNNRTSVPMSRMQNREPAERLSTLLNSTTVTDHFDQYSTHSSQFDRDYESPIRSTPQHTVRATPPPPPGGYSQPPHHPSHIAPHASHTLDRSPMSHMPPERHPPSDNLQQMRPLQRRKTLPSIMKGLPESGVPTANAAPRPGIIGETLSPPSAPVPPVELNRYVIEKGVRKRVQAEVYNRPTKPADPINRPKELPSRYKIETPLKLSKAAHRGSLPDVTACKELEKKVLPREEVSKMSERRRTELRMMQEEEERRRQQEIVLRLADFKDWCQQRQLLMLVIALNVSLATMFFNLLSQ